MAGKKSFFSRFRLVYRPSSPLLKCLLLATVVLSTVMLLTVGAQIHDADEQYKAARLQAAMEEARQTQLLKKASNADTVEGVKDIAKEEGGMVDPGTVFFTPEDNS